MKRLKIVLARIIKVLFLVWLGYIIKYFIFDMVIGDVLAHFFIIISSIILWFVILNLKIKNYEEK